jgi:hypothetical protein
MPLACALFTGDVHVHASRPVHVNATVETLGSVAKVIAAIASDANFGVSPGTPATTPPPIDPETSIANSVRFPAGSTDASDA